MLYNKEQLESFIGTLRDNIAMAEMLLAKNPGMDNAKNVEKILDQQKKSLERYIDQLNNSNQVGRPPIGVTKKVSLTLTNEEWDWLEENENGNRSRFLRGIVQKEIESSRK